MSTEYTIAGTGRGYSRSNPPSRKLRGISNNKFYEDCTDCFKAGYDANDWYLVKIFGVALQERYNVGMA